MKFANIDGMAEALFQESGDALFLFDPETDQILEVNSAVQRFTGFPLNKLLHMKVTDLLQYKEKKDNDSFHRAARKTTHYHSREGYYLQTAQDGVRIPVNITITRLHVKPKILGLITARDVRKQHEAYAKLERMEAQLRRIMTSISDCLWSATVDPTGKWQYHYISPVVEKITGRSAEYFLAGIHRWWNVVHPEDQVQWKKAVARQRAGQASLEEYRVVRPDGKSLWVRENVQASYDAVSKGTIRLHGVIAECTSRNQSPSG